jgi:hypothetical protein
MNILIDKEIDLNEKDLLNTKSYAKSLKDIVLNSPADQPFTIGLFGEWGSGKSSIVKTLSKDLEEQKEQKIKFIVYDAWKYSNDSFRRMFLLKVQNELGLKPTETMGSFYTNTNVETKIDKKFNLPYLTLVALAVLFCIAIWSWFGEPSKATVPLAIIVSILGFLGNVFAKAFNEYKITTQQPLLFAPEQFEACFNEMIGKALKKTSKFKKIVNYITQKEDGDLDKIIIVIDNIDRCHKDVAYELLTNTKNFIGSGLDVIFLIPVDDNALKQHIFKDESTESEEFLRKYFNVTIRIKPYKLTEIFDFASNINSEYKLGLKPDTINIIAKEYASNPRRIIQFYNNLQLELILFNDKYGKKFITDNEIAICKFLIIREEWNDEYMLLCNSPEMFFNDELTNFKPKLDEKFLSFIDDTYVSTRWINYDTLQKILINSDNYDTLPEAITQRIKKEEFEGFSAALADTGTSEQKIADYLLFTLKKAIKSNLFTTEVPDLLDQIYIFMVQFPELDSSYYGRLESEVRKRIDTFIDNTKNNEHLITFSNSALKHGFDFMHKYIISHFINFVYPEDQFLDSPLFELYQTYIVAANDQQLDIAKKAFPNYLNNTKLTDKVNKDLQPQQLETLYTQEIIQKYLIDPTIFMWDDLNHKQNWLWLAENLPKQLQLLLPLVSYADQSLTQNINGAFLSIYLFSELFTASKNVEADNTLIANLDMLNTKMLSNRIQPNGSTIRPLTQPEGSNPVTLNYLIEGYRITNGSQGFAVWIIELASLHGENIVKPALNILLERFPDMPLVTLKPLVMALQEINLITNNILLKALYQNIGDANVYTDEEIKQHLSRIFNAIKTNSEASELLIAHSRVDRARPILATVLTEIPEDELLQLDPKLQETTFDLITDPANVGRYKTNFPILSLIAKNGQSSHIKALTNSIKSNLTDKTHSDAALNWILETKNMDKEDIKDLNLFITQNKIDTIGDKKLVKSVLEKLANY